MILDTANIQQFSLQHEFYDEEAKDKQKTADADSKQKVTT
jgi:hypothetical protein